MLFVALILGRYAPFFCGIDNIVNPYTQVLSETLIWKMTYDLYKNKKDQQFGALKDRKLKKCDIDHELLSTFQRISGTNAFWKFLKSF